MTILTNFKLYTPEDPEKLALQSDINVLFIRSAEGVDWYDAQKLFKTDLLKIIFKWDTGEILSVSKDVTTLWPIDVCIADIEYDADASIEDFKDKVFNPRTGKIIDRVKTKKEIQAEADREVSNRMADATALISPLQYAKDLDMISEEESAYLKELQRYVVYLSRVTSQEGYPGNIVWPELPKK